VSIAWRPWGRSGPSAGTAGVGCGLVLEVEKGPDGAGGVRSGRAATGSTRPNAGRLCTKGATSAEMLAAPGRPADRPGARRARAPHPAEEHVDKAITEAARRLSEIIAKHGQRRGRPLRLRPADPLRRSIWPTSWPRGFPADQPDRGRNSRALHGQARAPATSSRWGADGPARVRTTISTHADVLLRDRPRNMADCHPILFPAPCSTGSRRGAKLIVADPRPDRDRRQGGPVSAGSGPGTDLALLNGLLHLLVEQGRPSIRSSSRRTPRGGRRWRSCWPATRPTRVAEITGIPAAGPADRGAVESARAGNWMSLWTMGLNQEHPRHVEHQRDLQPAPGDRRDSCRTGSGPFSLTGQPNAMGGAGDGLHGPGTARPALGAWCRPTAPFAEDRLGTCPAAPCAPRWAGARSRCSSGWRPAEIKACWIILHQPGRVGRQPADRHRRPGGRPSWSSPRDAYAETETNAYADIALPAAMWSGNRRHHDQFGAET